MTSHCQRFEPKPASPLILQTGLPETRNTPVRNKPDQQSYIADPPQLKTQARHDSTLPKQA
ncbi:hypothetical protein FH972_016221 [Carpinus fangiana]|uniref:Uncharacterized protein n=1 Tax=Carpinus fangiana TaxID=176857 RepID=A0A5N6RIR2_9ROSI|nr:hypothetical protein FH972_016221 [Carpinus fangiana]